MRASLQRIESGQRGSPVRSGLHAHRENIASKCQLDGVGRVFKRGALQAHLDHSPQNPVSRPGTQQAGCSPAQRLLLFRSFPTEHARRCCSLRLLPSYPLSNSQRGIRTQHQLKLRAHMDGDGTMRTCTTSKSWWVAGQRARWTSL